LKIKKEIDQKRSKIGPTPKSPPPSPKKAVNGYIFSVTA